MTETTTSKGEVSDTYLALSKGMDKLGTAALDLSKTPEDLENGIKNLYNDNFHARMGGGERMIFDESLEAKKTIIYNAALKVQGVLRAGQGMNRYDRDIDGENKAIAEFDRTIRGGILQPTFLQGLEGMVKEQGVQLDPVLVKRIERSGKITRKDLLASEVMSALYGQPSIQESNGFGLAA